MNCLIVDDEELSRMSLKYLCDKIEGIEVVGVCESAIDAIKSLNSNSIDLIFLDVEMPALSGMDLLKTVDEIPMIIFITSKAEYAVEAFEFKELVVDFITKPVALPRLMKAVDRAKDNFDSNNLLSITKDYFFIKSEGRIVRIDIDNLLYLETIGDYVRFKTSDNSYLVHSSLKKIELKFKHANFIKVHRSFIINISKIKNIEENSILIEKKIIPVSRAHKTDLINKLNPL